MSGVLFVVSLTGSFFMQDVVKKILTFIELSMTKICFLIFFCVSRVLFVVSLPGSFFMKDGEKKIFTFYRIVYDF